MNEVRRAIGISMVVISVIVLISFIFTAPNGNTVALLFWMLAILTPAVVAIALLSPLRVSANVKMEPRSTTKPR